MGLDNRNASGPSLKSTAYNNIAIYCTAYSFMGIILSGLLYDPVFEGKDFRLPDSEVSVRAIIV
jgi:hypothetical protein